MSKNSVATKRRNVEIPRARAQASKALAPTGRRQARTPKDRAMAITERAGDQVMSILRALPGDNTADGNIVGALAVTLRMALAAAVFARGGVDLLRKMEAGLQYEIGNMRAVVAAKKGGAA